MQYETGRGAMVSGNEGSFVDDLEREMGLLLHEQRRQEPDEHERELNIYRSGSAPPTVEGSRSAVSGFFSGGGGGGGNCGLELGGSRTGNGFVYDDDFRSDPAYLSYYYANVNLNPRLPPPILSREDLRVAQRLKGGTCAIGGMGDRWHVCNGAGNNNSGIDGSLSSLPPGFGSMNPENYEPADSEKDLGSAESGGNGLIGLPGGPGLGHGNKKKSLAEIFQDDSGHGPLLSPIPSRPASRNAFDANIEATNKNLVSPVSQGIGPGSSYTYATAVGASSSRSNTPDPQAVARAPSPCLTPIGSGRVSASEKRSLNSPNSFVGISSGINVSSDITAAFSGMNLSGRSQEANKLELDVEKHKNYLFNLNSGHGEIKQHGFLHNSEQPQKPTVSSRNPHVIRPQVSAFTGGFGSPRLYHHPNGPNSSFTEYKASNYSPNAGYATMAASQLGTMNFSPLFENAAAASALELSGINSRVLAGGFPSPGQNITESYDSGRIGNQMGAGGPLQVPFSDPMYLRYLRTSGYAAQLAALNDPSMDRAFMGNSYVNNVNELHKSYLRAPKSQHGNLYKSGGYYGSPTFRSGVSLPGSPFAYHVMPNSPLGPGSPMRRSELNLRFPTGPRNNFSGGHMGPWHLDGGLSDGFGSCLLEEFKSNKLRCFELADICGNVVEFSADQYGSRFIQQKLEIATPEEKNMVYEEITPQALTLMTDVFGNYVIQKLFEHGLQSQRRELAEKLLNNVLQLSLQMYGCRVIQKAIEVVDVDQKINMVKELDGHVMRCVRDQNGNHVIQKCIECVPEENIQFIISTFFEQVVTLSMHPYGCRVVQRILEHCKDPNTQSKVMEEILNSVSVLAQDQYGNYVVQHVLEHGLPNERTFIIKELAGKIVRMSQQKFASNVVEKCLTFGDPSERELLVNEMLGTTDENEPLQAMMKDQFANYVVQKVLETCDDQQMEHVLGRIKVHLNALKKYTYGKHIVARVEKLVAAGERRIIADSLNMSLVA